MDDTAIRVDCTPMHIGIAGPIATCDVAPLLDRSEGLPRGYSGAPLLTTLMSELLAHGHRVSAFTLSSDLPLRRDATVVAHGPNFELHYVPMRPRAWPPNGWRPGRIIDLYAFERAGLRRALASARPDLVHAHWSYEFAWAALSSGLPHVVTCHDSPLLVARMQRGWRTAGYRWLRAAMAWHVLRQAHVVTTVSPYLLGEVQPLCGVTVDVVPNPVGSAAFARRWVGSPHGRRILMVANGFDVRKNAQAGLRAFALLAQRLPGAELHAYGNDFGPGQAADRWWTAEGLCGRVRFLGTARHACVLDAMAACDALLHPALEESFGAVLAEALAIGLPVVAGEHSGAVPWVLGASGQLVDVRSPEAMADALVRVLEADDGEQRAGALRESVRRRFGADVVTQAFESVYRRAVGHPDEAAA